MEPGSPPLNSGPHCHLDLFWTSSVVMGPQGALLSAESSSPGGQYLDMESSAQPQPQQCPDHRSRGGEREVGALPDHGGAQ